MATILIYDSQCPFCAHEVALLARRDKAKQLDLVDLHSDRFAKDFPELRFEDANALLHARDEQGNWHYGLDATLLAWRAVGLGGWIVPLRWPLIRHVADLGYRLFARHRYRLSRLMGLGSADCARCVDKVSKHER